MAFGAARVSWITTPEPEIDRARWGGVAKRSGQVAVNFGHHGSDAVLRSEKTLNESA